MYRSQCWWTECAVVITPMLCSTSEGTEPTALLCQRLQVSETRCVFKAEQDQWFQQALRRHLSECRCHWGGRWRSGTPSVLPSWGEAAIHIPQGEPRTESGCVAVSALLLNGVELTGFGKSFEETCSLTHGLPHTVSATNGQPPGSRGLSALASCGEVTAEIHTDCQVQDASLHPS